MFPKLNGEYCTNETLTYIAQLPLSVNKVDLVLYIQRTLLSLKRKETKEIVSKFT